MFFKRALTSLRFHSSTIHSHLRISPSITGVTSTSFFRRCLSDLTRSTIEGMVKSHRVMIFIKGTRSIPQCGFSRAVVQLMDLNDVPTDSLETFNILENDEIRQAIKDEWPTFPQVYIDGEFFGGCDTLMEMHRTGELSKTLKSKKII
ncbi:monothiol glutaredoxin [Phakopsora pachyrhizi]|nr:monothiol glutaredoxin [Phakopsora pachyrhizi]